MIHSLVTIGIVALSVTQSTDAAANSDIAQVKKPTAAAQETGKPVLRDKPVPRKVIPKRAVAMPVRAQDVARPARDAAPPQLQTAIIKLRHAPASDVANALERWAVSAARTGSKTPINVVVLPAQNTVLVTTVPKVLETVRSLARELDQPAAQVRVKLAIVELSVDDEAKAAPKTGSEMKGGLEEALGSLQKANKMRVICRPELVALDSQQASAHFGSRVPRIVGASVSSRGRVNNVELDNVGTLVELIARVNDSQSVTVQLQLEHSHVGAEKDGTPIAEANGVEIRSPSIETIQLETTVTARVGDSLVLSGIEQKSSDSARTIVLLMQVEIVK